jgi:hypothetical protein
VGDTGISEASDMAGVPGECKPSENTMDDGVEGVETAEEGGKELVVPEQEPSSVNNTGRRMVVVLQLRNCPVLLCSCGSLSCL